MNDFVNPGRGNGGNRGYQRELDGILTRIRGRTEEGAEPPRLLLHCCCAPCSSYVLEYLSEYFRITCFFYNPNITEEEEYRKRAGELRRLIGAMPMKYRAEFREGPYDPEEYFLASEGLESEREGGLRCHACFRLRLRKAAEEAALGGYDFYTTTLTISPLKNAPAINAIGEALGRDCGVAWLPSDFKKKNGYLRSIELSKEYGLYRQNYCGCVFSKEAVCDRITGNSHPERTD